MVTIERTITSHPAGQPLVSGRLAGAVGFSASRSTAAAFFVEMP